MNDPLQPILSAFSQPVACDRVPSHAGGRFGADVSLLDASGHVRHSGDSRRFGRRAFPVRKSITRLHRRREKGKMI